MLIAILAVVVMGGGRRKVCKGRGDELDGVSKSGDGLRE